STSSSSGSPPISASPRPLSTRAGEAFTRRSSRRRAARSTPAGPSRRRGGRWRRRASGGSSPPTSPSRHSEGASAAPSGPQLYPNVFTVEFSGRILALLDLVTDTLRARGVEVVIGFDD